MAMSTTGFLKEESVSMILVIDSVRPNCPEPERALENMGQRMTSARRALFSNGSRSSSFVDGSMWNDCALAVRFRSCVMKKSPTVSFGHWLEERWISVR